MISRYIRSNLLGFVAIFLALSGLAVAAGLPKNSVKSKQIKDGQVKSADVADNGLTGVDINESTLQGLGSGAAGPVGPEGPPGPSTGPAGGDLAGSYPNPSIADNAVNSGKVADDSLGGADIDEAGVLEVMFADVNGVGAVVRTNAGATSSVNSTGNYVVDFNRELSNCSWIAGLGLSGFGGNEPPGTIEATGAELTTDSVYVNTTDLAGANSARAFHVWVTC